jgi:hypothetical protein
MRFLEQNHLDSLSCQVAPLHPYPMTHVAGDQGSAPLTLDAADELTSRIEGPGRYMPVLLRHYLKLNARVLGFSIDPSFGNALDALMMVDLLRVDSRILRRYSVVRRPTHSSITTSLTPTPPEQYSRVTFENSPRSPWTRTGSGR